MSKAEEAWAGEFGEAYTARNQIDWYLRVPFWRATIPHDVRSVMEVGCNAGWNLTAMRYSMPHLGLHGIDLNVRALEQARAAGLDCFHAPARYLGRDAPNVYDLVFTAGLLIHVPPEDLVKTMISIIQASRRYVVAVEYEAEEETEIVYRGERDMLWKRPFGRLYQDLGLELVSTVPARKADGFDECTAWLLRKP